MSSKRRAGADDDDQRRSTGPERSIDGDGGTAPAGEPGATLADPTVARLEPIEDAAAGGAAETVTELAQADTMLASSAVGRGVAAPLVQVGAARLAASGLLDDEGLTDEHPKRYRIDHELGQGGIGKVFVALDTHLGREVALKELLASSVDAGAPSRMSGGPLSTRSPMELRFVNEARVTGQLEHPGIVPVYELGRRQDGTIYYVMRLVRGRTLAAGLESCPLRGRLELLPNFVDLCHAVAYAHSRGVVHRDLKPDNVMLGDFGETVVLDWGLAKVRGQRDVQSYALAEALERLQEASAIETVAGLPIGTPSYMPPEQALGELDQVDERSDVYALGAVLYQLLTGDPPFTGKTALEVVRRVVREEPVAPPELEAHCPPELSAIALRALSKQKDERYADAAALAKDVRAFLTGGMVGAHQYSPKALLWRWLERHRVGLLVAVVALGVGLGAWLYRGYDVARRTAQVQAAAEQRRSREVMAEVDRILDEAVRGSIQPRWLDTLAYMLIGLDEPLVSSRLEDRLVTTLAHESPNVRRLAARTLGGLKSARAVEPLGARLAKGVEPLEDVLIEVVNALGVIGDARAELPVRDVRWRAGQSSRLWNQTELAFRMIPLPPVPAAGFSAERWTDRGRAMAHKADYHGALQAYAKALEIDPKLARAISNRAVLRKQLGDHEGALADYDLALQLNPDSVAALHNRALVKRTLGDYEGALADLDRVLATDTISAMALRNRAITKRYQGRYEDALADLRVALEQRPDDARSHVNVAFVFLQMQRWDESLRAFNRAITSNEAYVYALNWRAIVRQITGDPQGALADYERAIDLDPSTDLGRRGRATLRLAAGDRDGARADLDLCIRAHCPHGFTRQGMRLAQRGIVLHAQLGDFEQARKDLQRAVEATPNPDQRIEYRLALLILALRLGEPELPVPSAAWLQGRDHRLWHSQLALVAQGELSYESLAQKTFEATRRCTLELAAAVRAELDGHGELALAHYRRAAATPRPTALPRILGEVAADALAGQ